MAKILLNICFLGSAYHGYQVQPNGVTVQQRLGDAAMSLFGFECDIVGCSRTDSGVHANTFYATVTQKGTDSILTSIPVEKIPAAISFYLPDDISVKSATLVDDNFHPRYAAKSKEYLYRIWNGRYKNPFEIGRSWHYPKKLDAVAIEKMNLAAEKLVGTHDFTSFMAAGSKVTDTVRTIYNAQITSDGDFIYLHISGNGFLYNMVRIIMGTLIDVAEGRLAPDSIVDIIESRDRSKAGATAPACGLYLNDVTY